MDNKKISISATIDEVVHEEVLDLASPQKEDRSFSKMLEILLKEALLARRMKSKKLLKK